MKRIAILTAVFLLSFGIQLHADIQLKRYALVIGANNGGAELVRLHYAGQDAQSVANVLIELGGVAPADCIRLDNPTVSQLVTAFNGLRRQVTAANSLYGRTEVFVYYSGHSDEQGLRLGSERLSYADLRNLIDSLPSNVKIGILDSCSSGMMTRLKGGTAVAPFMLDASASMEGYAYLTSSSYDEASQESDAVGGSFFTYYLVSGLRGAADSNVDSKVTLNELYQFTFDETLSRTQQTMGGPQHPGYDIEMSGSGDVVITDLHRTSAYLVLKEDLNGRVFVRNGDGKLVAELNKIPQRTVTIGLEPGTYSIMLQQNNSQLRQGQFRIPSGGQVEVTLARLTPVASESTVSRGGTFITTTTNSVIYTYVSTNTTEVTDRAPSIDITVQNEYLLPVNASSNVVLSDGTVPETNAGNTNFSLLESFYALTNRDYYYNPVDISFWPGMGVGGYIFNLPGKKVINTFSYNIVGGYSTILIGAAFGGIWRKVDECMFGYQEAGIAASVGGNAIGAQTAGIAAKVDGYLVGAQFAGIATSVGKYLVGAQVAGIAASVGGNLWGGQMAFFSASVGGNLAGFEVAGISTSVKGHVTGFQIAGVVNRGYNNMLGVQIAGVANHLDGDLIGLQIAGVVNNNKGFVNGAQIAFVNHANRIQGGQIGLVNTANVVNGLQIGLVNVSRTMNGIPIGLVTICRDGYNHISYWRDETLFNTLAMTWGTKYIYSTVGLGVNDEGSRLSLSAGMGMHFPVGKVLFFDAESLWDNIVPLNEQIQLSANWSDIDSSFSLFTGNVQNLVRVRLKAGIQVTKWLSIVGGVSYNVYIPRNNTWDAALAPSYGIKTTEWVSDGYKSWPGFFVGIQLL